MNVALRTPELSGCDCSAPAPRLISVQQALDEILKSVTPLPGSFMLPLADACGRIAAATVISAVPLPRFDNSAMDGYGVHADDLSREHPFHLRLVDRVAAGRGSVAALQRGTTVQILTGAPLPPGVAAVVPHEETRRSGDHVIVGAAAKAGANIRRAGEDIAAAQALVHAGTRLDVRHVALLSAAGVCALPVKPRVRVGLLSTGDELTEAGEGPGRHRIVDTNRPLLSNLLDTPDVELHDFGIVADRTDAIARRIVEAAASCDLLLTSGGICGSDADHVASAIRAAGGTCWSIKLALKPGKPIGLGRVGSATILCLPGNPVSVLATAVLFVRPLLRHLNGARQKALLGIPAVAADVFCHSPGRIEFVPVEVVSVDARNRRHVRSLPRGSHRLSSLAAADGFAEIASERGEVQQGQPLLFHPFDSAWAL